MYKIRFHTLGCKLNFAESSAIAKSLLACGFAAVSGGEPADVCIINTCTVTDAADRKGRQAIHRIRRENPDAILIVTGCYSQFKREEVETIDGIDYIVSQEDKEQIPALVRNIVIDLQRKSGEDTLQSYNQETQKKTVSTDLRLSNLGGRTRYFLKVQDGCDYFCTYCAIPFARGRSRNEPIEKVLSRAREVIDEGYKELVLTGVNIGDFGKSTGETFINLCRSLDEVSSDVRFRISSCEPNLLSDELIDFVASSRHFAPHFHIPLQSGSNEILQIMHRRYTRELFRERVEHIRRVMPNAFIGVDCMVGVRGETAELFEDYRQFVASLDVSQLHVFTYSEREGTRMVSQNLYIVPSAERRRRSDIMHRLSEEKHRTFCEKHRGEEAVVLWESKKKNGMMSGFTENYIKVECDYDKKKINTFEKIYIEKICT